VDKIRNIHNTESKWHKLDNTANIFPVISNKSFSSVYRVSVRLKQDIIPEVLQRALDVTLPWFDNFQVRLRHGLFWYYFETNRKQSVICMEQPIPCAYIAPSSNNHFLFRVYYFEKRISLEVFHAITDGTGAFNFLKELTFNYIRLAHQQDMSAKIDICPSVDITSNIEDSYIKNYKKFRKEGYSTEKAYQMKGEKLPLFLIGVIHGYIDTKSLLNLCKEKHATVTQYLATVMVWCIYKEFLNEQPHKHPVRISVPVNLRPFFDSTTTMNFFSVMAVGFKIERGDYTFDEMLERIKIQFKEQLTKDNFLRKIAFNVATGKNIVVRFVPLPLKNLFVKIGYLRSAKANSISLSNLGRIDVPDIYKPEIENFEVLMSATNSEPTKCSLCTYEDKFVVTFTSRLSNTYLQRSFFRRLAADGIGVVIESNGVYNENL